MTLKTARRRAKLSQRQLANLVGVHPSSISYIENGKRPTTGYETIVRICQAVGMTPEELFPVRPRRRRAKLPAADLPVSTGEIHS